MSNNKDFLNGSFDFNDDGYTNSAEEYYAYNIYQEMKEPGEGNTSPGQFFVSNQKNIDWYDVFIIVLLAYHLLSLFASSIY